MVKICVTILPSIAAMGKLLSYQHTDGRDVRVGTMPFKKAIDMFSGRKDLNMTMCLPEHCGGLQPHKILHIRDYSTWVYNTTLYCKCIQLPNIANAFLSPVGGLSITRLLDLSGLVHCHIVTQWRLIRIGLNVVHDKAVTGACFAVIPAAGTIPCLCQSSEPQHSNVKELWMFKKLALLEPCMSLQHIFLEYGLFLLKFRTHTDSHSTTQLCGIWNLFLSCSLMTSEEEVRYGLIISLYSLLMYIPY